MGDRDAFGELASDDQTADQPWPRGGRDGRQSTEFDACPSRHVPHQVWQVGQMEIARRFPAPRRRRERVPTVATVQRPPGPGRRRPKLRRRFRRKTTRYRGWDPEWNYGSAQ